MKRILRATAIAIALLSITLAGCKDGNVRDSGGGGSSSSGGSTVTDTTDTTNDSDDTGDDSSDDGDTNTEVVRIGSYSGSGEFLEGQISAKPTALKTGENSKLTLFLVDDNGNAVTDPLNVGFSSPCINAGFSQVQPATVTNSSGRVDVTYTANGCDGIDRVEAKTTFDGQVLHANVILETEQRTIRFGSIDDSGDFTEGTIAADALSLTAGESSTLTVSLVDGEDELITDEVDIYFNSPCVSDGTSEFEPRVVTTDTGTASTIYTARGCESSDVITALVSLQNNDLTATVTIDTVQAPLGTISFVSADPSLIGIAGTDALVRQSTVTFKVMDSTGSPVANQVVDFSLTTEVGGITLSHSQASTNNEGLVSTVVESGSVATVVRVVAETSRDGKTVSAQSNGLAITTGKPDNDSVSLSAKVLNIEGLALDGNTTEVTVRAADRYNNPVPDGTSFHFTTEGGSIKENCLTVDGACSVTFTTQNPRPIDGRATILVTGIGEETFQDAGAANGRFDDGELFQDIPEAFRDDNESGVRNADELYIDYNNNGAYDGANGLFDGLLCDGPSQCGELETTVYDQLVLIMSGSSLIVQIAPDPIDLNGGAQTVQVFVQDVNGQKPPAGTTVDVSSSQGSILGDTTQIQASSNAPGASVFEFILQPGDEAKDGIFTAKVTTPGDPDNGIDGVISRDTASVDQTP